jgi:hypothetical protein
MFPAAEFPTTRCLYWRACPISEPFHGAELAGEFGVDGAATAISPSNRRFALVVRGQILLFDLTTDLKATFRARLDVPALVDGGAVTGSGQNYACPVFVGEDSIGIARPDGLILLVDIAGKQEIWRFRVPDAPRGARVPRRNSRPARRSWLAVRGDHFAIVLDAGGGLPLSPPARSYFYGNVGPQSESTAARARDHTSSAIASRVIRAIPVHPCAPASACPAIPSGDASIAMSLPKYFSAPSGDWLGKRGDICSPR